MKNLLNNIVLVLVFVLLCGDSFAKVRWDKVKFYDDGLSSNYLGCSKDKKLGNLVCNDDYVLCEETDDGPVECSTSGMGCSGFPEDKRELAGKIIPGTGCGSLNLGADAIFNRCGVCGQYVGVLEDEPPKPNISSTNSYFEGGIVIVYKHTAFHNYDEVHYEQLAPDECKTILVYRICARYAEVNHSKCGKDGNVTSCSDSALHAKGERRQLCAYEDSLDGPDNQWSTAPNHLGDKNHFVPNVLGCVDFGNPPPPPRAFTDDLPLLGPKP